jgi:hypothetical protein
MFFSLPSVKEGFKQASEQHAKGMQPRGPGVGDDLWAQIASTWIKFNASSLYLQDWEYSTEQYRTVEHMEP